MTRILTCTIAVATLLLNKYAHLHYFHRWLFCSLIYICMFIFFLVHCRKTICYGFCILHADRLLNLIVHVLIHISVVSQTFTFLDMFLYWVHVSVRNFYRSIQWLLLWENLLMFRYIRWCKYMILYRIFLVCRYSTWNTSSFGETNLFWIILTGICSSVV